MVYWPDPGDLLVIAVAHQQRKPGYWGSRLLQPDWSNLGSPDAISAEALLRFVSSAEGERFATLGRGTEFGVRVLDTGLEITPASSGKPRLIKTGVIDRVCEAYKQSRSLKPGDYHKMTFDASYLLALIELYARRSRR